MVLATVHRVTTRSSYRSVKSAALILSLVAGAFLMALSLGTSGHSWLGWLTLLPLFIAIRALRPPRAMLCGALWGLSLHVFAVSVFTTGISSGLSSLALLTAIPAAYALLASWVTRRIGFSPFVLGVSWMGVELALRPLGLHHGLLAATQGDSTLMQWAGGALGYVLVAFVVALGNAVLLLLLSRVPVGVASSGYLPGSSKGGTRLVPQTFSCFPLFAIPVSRPRAPPFHR